MCGALLCHVAAVVPAARASEPVFHTQMNEGDFTVVARLEEQRAAERVLEVASSRGADVAERAGLTTLGPVTIHVASTDQEFVQLTYGGVPDWGVGCAFPGRGVVVIRNPVTAPDPLGMEDVVAHEIAHIAAGRVLGDVPVPRWFHEGIAMTLAGEWRLPRSSALSSAGAGGHLIPLDNLRRAFPADPSQAMLAYSESFYALRFLMDEADSATPAEILLTIAASASFEQGIESLTGRTLAEFERDAVASFRRRFGWGVFLARWNVLFALLALLLLTGGVLRLARSRRRMREWEEEELLRMMGGSVAPRPGRDGGDAGDKRSGWN
jgi:hypothetical protein